MKNFRYKKYIPNAFETNKDESWFIGVEYKLVFTLSVNNHINNLEWVTVSENGLHAYRVLGIQAWNKGKKLKQQLNNGV